MSRFNKVINLNKDIRVMALFVVILAFVVFIPNLNDSFLSDDYDFLSRVDSVHDWRSAYQQINPSGHGFWRPVLNFSFMINYLVFGEDSAFAYHLFNNFLHALTAGMLVLIVYFIFNKNILAVLSGLLFAIYPMHHESVTWIAGRTDVLTTFFFVFSLYFAIKFFKTDRYKYNFYSLTLFCLAVLSKEMAITLPAIIFITEFVWFRKTEIKHYLQTYIPFFIVWVLYFLGRFLSIGLLLGGYTNFGQSIHFKLPILAILVSPTYYFTKIINIHFLLDFQSEFIHYIAQFWSDYRKVILLIIVLVLFLLQSKKTYWRGLKQMIVFYFLFIIASAPVWAMLANIQQNGMDTRFLYLPSVFGSILLAFLLTNIQKKTIKNILIAVIICFFVAANIFNYIPWQKADEQKQLILSKLTEQVGDIKDEEFIYVANLPDNYFGAYMFRNGFEESFENFLKDESVFPDFAKRKVWQLKSEGEFGHMCDDSFRIATHFYVWNPLSASFDDGSYLLNLNPEVKTLLVYTDKKETQYSVIEWSNVLWAGLPDNFQIKYPFNMYAEDVLKDCPLWLLSNIKTQSLASVLE